MTTSDAAVHPKAMVSYAWGDDAQQARVRQLVDHLRGDGIDVVFDRYNLSDGDDVNAFMEQVAAQGTVRKVIAICDPLYVQKMNARKGGSGQEGMIMSPHVYDQLRATLATAGQTQERRFIAVIFERSPDLPEHDPKHLPTMFGSMKYIDMSTPERYDQNYDQLLRFLLDKPEFVAPPIGQIPAHLREDAPAPLPGASQIQAIRRRLDQDRSVESAWRDYLEQVEGTLRAVAPALQPAPDGTPLHQRTFLFQVILDEVERLLPLRNAFVDTLRDTIRRGTLPINDLIAFFERVMHLGDQVADKHREGNTVLNAVCFNHADLLVMELTLYMATVLVQEGQVDALKEVTEHTYFRYRHGEAVTVRFNDLQDVREQSEFERQYRTATGQNWTSPLGAWLRARATLETVPWAALSQADFLLFLKSALERDPKEWGGYWRPLIAASYEHQPTPDLFVRFTSRKVLERWAPFFGASDASSLRAALNTAFPDRRFNEIFSNRYSSYTLEAATKMSTWGTRN